MTTREIYHTLRAVKLSLIAHPDCTTGSEFADYVSSLDSAMKEMERRVTKEKTAKKTLLRDIAQRGNEYYAEQSDEHTRWLLDRHFKTNECLCEVLDYYSKPWWKRIFSDPPVVEGYC